VNALDLAIVFAIVIAAICGYRLGFVARALSWAGLAGALVIAIQLIPDLMSALATTSPRGRLIAVLAFVLGLGLLGQALGLAAGALLHARLPSVNAIQRSDRIAGAAVGACGVVVLLWLVLPALTSAPGWPARAAQGSEIASTIEQVAPEPPASLRELGRMVAEEPYPEVFSALDDGPPEVGAPPELALPAAADGRVRAAVVRVEGRACDQIQDGTGFVVRPGIVATNAHVVAGENTTSVFLPNGDELSARVVRFDPRRDLALLAVDGLRLAPLTISEGRAGLVGAVYGHPGGGPLRAAPARIAEEIDARGKDIYRTTDTSRDVFVLAAQLAPGDSGAPLVDQAGRVVGVAFAIDPGREGTAYALTSAELQHALAAVSDSTVETGSCLVG
jgi:S1-C subfamily serine protease